MENTFDTPVQPYSAKENEIVDAVVEEVVEETVVADPAEETVCDSCQ